MRDDDGLLYSIGRKDLFTALDNLIESIQITDATGKIIWVNKTFERHTQIPRRDILGRRSIDFPDIYKPSIVNIAMHERREISAILDGVAGPSIATATPIFDENNDIKMVVSINRFAKDTNLFKELFQNKEVVKGKKSNELSKPESHHSDMNEIIRLVGKIAEIESNVLITGETGTGKNYFARYIHSCSERKNKNFIEVNCGAIPETLLESELFGYEDGAFTGSRPGGKLGYFEMASGGTLFLDEIGDLPLHLQVKLFHALQSKNIMRLGSERSIPVDIRLITATSLNLEDMVKKGEFRPELYYRIKVIPINLPPLRMRKNDIPDLIHIFLQKFCNRYNLKREISYEAVKLLSAYHWPGNIRELENLVEQLVVINTTGYISPSDLPNYILKSKPVWESQVNINGIMPLKEAITEVERILVKRALEKGGSSYQVAKLLGISQSAANRKILKYKKIK